MKKTISICLASDDKYMPFIATTVASICHNTKSFVQFYVLARGISDFSKKQIETLKDKYSNFSIEYRSVNLEALKKIKTRSHISLDTYSRFFIPDLFPECTKMIYMDIDIIVLGDIGKLYDVDLGDYSLGAVPAEYIGARKKWKKNMHVSPEHKYFNAGVLLINPKKMKSENFMGRAVKIADDYSRYISMGDQDILNKYFDGNYKPLDIKYNLTNNFIQHLENHRDVEKRAQIEVALEQIVVRHYEDRLKPWNSNKDVDCNYIKNFNDFWFFAKLTPFYEGLSHNFIACQNNKNFWRKGKLNIRLFSCITLLKIKCKPDGAQKIYLFGVIPILKIK
jgi:lipopolysaccharide biosynthesis glycosyltransferase